MQLTYDVVRPFGLQVEGSEGSQLKLNQNHSLLPFRKLQSSMQIYDNNKNKNKYKGNKPEEAARLGVGVGGGDRWGFKPALGFGNAITKDKIIRFTLDSASVKLGNARSDDVVACVFY